MLSPAEIDLDDPNLQWVNKENRTFEDPLGHIFRGADGFYYRAVHRAKADVAKTLVTSGILDQLAKEDLIPPQEVIEVGHPKYCMLLRSPAAPWKIKVRNYPRAAIKAAALVWLRINARLASLNFGLIDGHHGNFAMFSAGRPMWIDIGSFVPLEGRREVMAFEQFARQFIYPLVVLANKPKTMRSDIFVKQGISLAYAIDLLNDEEPQLIDSVKTTTAAIGESVMRLQWLKSDRIGSRRDDAIQLPAKLRDIRWIKRAASRPATIERWSRHLEQLDVTPSMEKWSNYKKGISLDRVFNRAKINDAVDQRDRVIADLVEKINPSTVLDVGCNVGFHSALFATMGSTVLGVDTDEFAINSFYTWIQRKPKLNLYAAVDGFSTARHRADLVIALALTHHLAISGKLSFDAIAKRFAEMTERTLIVEFMPNGLGIRGNVRPNPLPAHYRLENFLKALSNHFATTRVIEYSRPADRSPRILIHCTVAK